MREGRRGGSSTAEAGLRSREGGCGKENTSKWEELLSGKRSSTLLQEEK